MSRRLRGRARATALGAAAVAGALALGLATVSSREPGRVARAPVDAVNNGTDAYDELVARNYRVLGRRQTRRLLDFADAIHACLARRGIEVGQPTALTTKIELALDAHVDRETLARAGTACGDALGGPPAGATLQAVTRAGGAMVLYLPKQCLLDPKVVR